MIRYSNQCINLKLIFASKLSPFVVLLFEDVYNPQSHLSPSFEQNTDA